MSCNDYFLRLLSRREYTASELMSKGKEKGFTEDEINTALAELQEKDYQSDNRFIISLITSYQGKYGKFAIKRKCQEKGIKADVFEEIWEQQNQENDEPNSLDSLKAKVVRKYKIEDFHNIDPKTKSKLWNYLQYRGFSPAQVLQQWQEDE